MESVKFNRQRGQILVQVALMVGALFAFVALALDGGNIYAGRRRMQNAADAGALAGAREICFGKPTEAVSAALNYAIERNGAQDADVDVVSKYTVTVVASQTLDTFFAGIIGINTADVRADATAVCGGAVTAGGTWPLAFKYEAYSDTIECGQQFIVFASKESGDMVCADDYTCVEPGSGITETDEEAEDLCNCNAIGPHLRTADRGWLQFFDPGEAYPDDCKAHANCGANELGCWIRNDHPGPVALGDCVPGEAGVVAASKDDVDSRIGDVVNIVLWDRQCVYDDPDIDDPDPLGDCSGTPYHVAAFGCVEVVGWEQNYDVPECGDPDKACKNGNNLKAVHVIKICDDEDRDADSEPPDPYDLHCSSSSGSTGGELPDDLELRAVSLVR